MALKVALAAGHHNFSGGNRIEYAIVGDLCEDYAAAFRRRGVDVRIITPDGPDADTDRGDGDYEGDLTAVGRQVVDWAGAEWVADLFIELHTEGVPIRGSFGVYPDWGLDVDLEAADLGEDIANAIRDAVGIPLRQGGSMSEKATQVGRSGSRLGVFAVTAPLRQTLTRLIMEHGSHAHADDLRILRNTQQRKAIAEAAVGAIVKFFAGKPAIPSDPDFETFPTGIRMDRRYGFYQYWKAHGGAEIFGYPITDEMQEDGRTVQWFERARFELHRSNGANVVMLGRVGAELLELRGREAKTAPNQPEGGD